MAVINMLDTIKDRLSYQCLKNLKWQKGKIKIYIEIKIANV